MPTKNDFKVNDFVRFAINRSETRSGRIVKLNPKTAKVDVDGQSWSCPYAGLNHAKPPSPAIQAQKEKLLNELPDFKPSDAVSFRSKRGEEVGHISSISKGLALVVTEDDVDFRVGLGSLKKQEGVASKQVKTKNERARLNFNVGDKVTFLDETRSQDVGRIVRLNQKYAQVDIDGQLWRVGYVGLRHADASVDRSANLKRLNEIEEEAQGLLAKHGLADWRLTFDHAARRGGQCRVQMREIGITERFALAAKPAEVTDTILHEIAHALVGPAHGHDATWKAMASRIGCTGKVTHDVDFSTARWIMTCKKCGWEQPRMRRLRGARCTKCHAPIAYYSNSPK